VSTESIDFDVHAESAGDGRYRIGVAYGLPVTEPQKINTGPLPEGLLQWRDLFREAQRHARPPHASPTKVLGNQLFDTLFAGPTLDLWRRALARRPGTGLRLNLRLTQVPELAALPWELLYDPDERSFVAMLSHVTLRRLQATSILLSQPRSTRQLRLLVALASPDDFPRLDVERESQAIQAALQPHNRGVRVDTVPHATWLAVRQCLDRARAHGQPFHIFHFVGHGGAEGDVHGAKLLFEDDDRKADAVGIDRLQAAFENHPSLNLLVLNSCHGAAASPDDAFSGLAQGLVYRAVPAAVSMQLDIDDQAAIEFAANFYGALGAGAAVDAAMAQTRKEMHALGRRFAWWLPVLLLRSPDAALLQLPPPSSAAKAAQRLSRYAGRLAAAVALAVAVVGGVLQWSRSGGAAVAGSPAVTRPVASPECRLPAKLDGLGMTFRKVGSGDAFCIQTTELTQAQWNAVMHGGNPSRNLGDARPVDSVSWNGANRFIERLNELAGAPLFRLPTGPEWEVAARAGSETAYSFGDDPSVLPRYGHCGKRGVTGQHTVTVASLEPNAWGLFDMYGNVEEWVGDTAAPDGSRTLRGGSWAKDPAHCRSASRDQAQPDYPSDRVGFRLARDLSSR
jgi:hypothetical protein